MCVCVFTCVCGACVCLCVSLLCFREDFRVAAYLAKSIAYMNMEPYTVEVRGQLQTSSAVQSNPGAALNDSLRPCVRVRHLGHPTCSAHHNAACQDTAGFLLPSLRSSLPPSLPPLAPGAPVGFHLQVSPAGYNLTTVKVDSTVVVSPKRSWLLPPSLLLPDIPIRATIKLGVRGPLESGMVRCLGTCGCQGLTGTSRRMPVSRPWPFRHRPISVANKSIKVQCSMFLRASGARLCNPRPSVCGRRLQGCAKRLAAC